MTNYTHRRPSIDPHHVVKHVLCSLTVILVQTPALAKGKDDFSQYPAKVVRAHAQPVLHGDDYLFRTVLRKGMSQGINFAGHLTFVEIGWGAGSAKEWVVDRKTGFTLELPISGSGPEGDQTIPYPMFEMRPNSRLLKAEWTVSEYGDAQAGCMRQDFVWEGDDLRELAPAHKARCKLHRPEAAK